MLSALDYVLVAVAGLVAGGINAVAGGGTLVTYPGLLAAGLPPLTANVTNTVGVLPGHIGGAIAYRREIRDRSRRLWPLALTVGGGALLGAALLLTTSADVFEAVVPWLVLAASGLMAVQPRVRRLVERRGGTVGNGALYPAMLLGGVYGGYFGAALGVVMLAILGLVIPEDLHRVNALKNVLALLPNAVGAAVFAAFADVHWAAAGLLAASALVGGLLAGHTVRRLPPDVLRWIAVGFGLVAGIWLLLR